MKIPVRMGLLTLLVWTSATGSIWADNKPNIVIIFADDLGFGDLTCYDRQSKIQTPHLDRLARQGMRFTDAHTASAVCTPSRYALLTGRYAWRTRLKKGVLGGFNPPLLQPDETTLATLLKKQGYRTACIGKWHLGLQWATTDGKPNDTPRMNDPQGIDFSKPLSVTPNQFGFDEFFGIAASLDMPPYCWIENNKVTQIPTGENKQGGRPGPTAPGWRHEKVLPKLADKAIDFIKQNKTRPFFLYMPLNAPHTPVVPNKEFLGKSKLDDYGDFVLEVDHHVGRVLKCLDDQQLADNTLVIFTSDNGPETNMYSRRKKFGHDSSSHFLGAKRDNWEGGHRVPFLVRWPKKIPGNSTCGQPVGVVDLFATVAGALGMKYPEKVAVDSYNLMPLLTQKNNGYDSKRILIHHSSHGHFAVRQGDWKLILHPGSGGNGYGKRGRYANTPESAAQAKTKGWQLYNLKTDPNETNNLADSNPRQLKQLTHLAINAVKTGRTTPGHSLNSTWDQSKAWPQLEWMKTDLSPKPNRPD